MISTELKSQLVKKFGKTEKDSGSTEVQVAILTHRINGLREHFDAHKHDFHSNRGLLKLVGKRRSLLKYLRGKNEESYKKLISELGLRK